MNKTKPGPEKGKTQDQVKRSPLGERLCKIRKSRGLTQEQLGELVGLSKRMIAHYEAGSKAMTVVSLQKIAKALGVTIAHLTGEKKNVIKEAEVKPALKKRIETLKKLPQADQQAIFKMIDALETKNNI